MGYRSLNRIIRVSTLLVAATLFVGNIALAAPSGGRTAADFLSIGLGARASGLGGAYTAISEGSVAAYWNPAGLSDVQGGEVLLGHYSWLQDITLEHGTVAHQIGDRTALAASVTFLNYGQVDGYDVNGVMTGDISAYDLCGAVSIGTSTGYDISVGLTTKFINQKLDDLNASTFAVDIGAMYETERLSLAAVIANVGPDMGFGGVKERLPTAARIGVAVRPFGRALLTSVEVEKKAYGGAALRNGFEANFAERYFLRAGYAYYPTHDTRSFGYGMSLGAGVRLAWGEIDYAFSPEERFSSETLHRLTLALKFDQK
ncbi:MAG TPA: PorV/PorQ family protein [Candidatus Deferrimicrobium sp.]|nr:PorV/PorQ family protein [Candidatus Deferrimicrobium sp.]